MIELDQVTTNYKDILLWLHKLPIQMQVVLADHTEADLDKLAKSADNMYYMLTAPAAHTEVFVARTKTSVYKSTTTEKNIASILKQFTTDIAARRADNTEISNQLGQRSIRSRTHSTSGNSSPEKDQRARSSFGKQSRDRRPRLYGCLCWYHFNFGDDAKRCGHDKCKMSNVSTLGN